MKKTALKSILVAASLLTCALQTMAQNSDKVHMLGLLGGLSVTSNPPALQQSKHKANYVDGNGGLTYLFHNTVSDGYCFEWQLSLVASSVNALNASGEGTKVKFIVPLDFRWFLGDYQKIQAYIGLGLQYNTVWVFTSSEDNDVHYNIWTDSYTTSRTTWEWTVNQFSSNVAVGFKIPFGNVWINRDYVKMHSVLLGIKGHIPIINSSGYYVKDDTPVDMSKDKTNLSITGGISFGFSNGGAIKIDIEYPLGGSNNYKVNDGGHATFFNTHSWSVSATWLFRVG